MSNNYQFPLELPLRDVIDFVVGGGTPARTMSSYWDGDIPWASVKDFKEGNHFIYDTEEHITQSGLANSASNMTNAGTVLVCTRMAVGRAAMTVQPMAINQDLKAIYPKEILDAKYLLYSLQLAQPSLEAQAIGSTVKGISLKQLLSTNIFVPSPSEQRAIAAVLDAVDAAIQRAEQLIAKLKLMKAGLLHDLLTRGIDAEGNLRDPVAHPEQFKESMLGLIPSEWEISMLGDAIKTASGVIQTGPFGSQLHANEYQIEGVPVVMPQDIEGDQIIEDNIARISPRRATDLSRHKLRENDIVFARRGDLERCAAISAREVGWLCGTGCLLLRVSQDAILGQWLSLVYQHFNSQRQIQARAVGSTMVNLNTKLLSDLTVAFPSVSEQERIVTVGKVHSTRIRTEEVARDKLRLFKAGLMDDLLTGRVRVGDLKVDLP